MQLWIAGRHHEAGPPAARWELLGIYDNEQAAVERCELVNDFVGPVTLNEKLPDETVTWPGLYYPVHVVAQQPCN